jgi:hypothetical protein
LPALDLRKLAGRRGFFFLDVSQVAGTVAKIALLFICTVRANGIRIRSMKCKDPTVAEEFELDVLNESDVELPGKLADLIRQIDRRQSRRVRVVQLTGDGWLLRWEERHPEMLSAREYLGERYWTDRQARLEYRRLENVLPPKRFELPLTRQQAFALVAACWLPEEFAAEVESVLN